MYKERAEELIKNMVSSNNIDALLEMIYGIVSDTYKKGYNDGYNKARKENKND